MVWVALGLAVAALVMAIRAGGGVKAKVERLESDLRYRESQITGLREEFEGQLKVMRLHLALVAQGKPVSEAMIMEGQLFDDIDAKEAYRIFSEQDGTVVLDVRTPDEYTGGHVPGALHIPVDQIERRWSEVPKDAPNVVVHCAAGARSASACAFLSSQKGYTNLRNVAGPLVGSWGGELERGAAP